MVTESRIGPDHIQLMVHRLEAQERASTRMMDRVAAYAVFSFAVLSLYVGALFAIPEDGPSLFLLIGAFALAVPFGIVFLLFCWTHRPANLKTIPNPDVIAAYSDVEGNSQAIEKAFTYNAELIKGDLRRSTWMGRMITFQVMLFLGFALVGLIAA